MNPRGTDRLGQQTKPWLTPAGCQATGGHKPDRDNRCLICGAATDPQQAGAPA